MLQQVNEPQCHDIQKAEKIRGELQKKVEQRNFRGLYGFNRVGIQLARKVVHLPSILLMIIG